MSKQVLQDMFTTIESNQYVWTLYFFKIDHRGKRQPYSMYKVRFRDDKYLPEYAGSLLNATRRFQVDPLSKVQNYDGENTKVTCDKINLKDNLIADQWTSFFNAAAAATDRKIDGKLHGYILSGQGSNDTLKPVTFVKIANPITNMKTKKAVVFTNSNDELDLMSDDVYRLYLTVDFIVYDDNMYTFNHSFEKLFNLEQTMTKVKTVAIDKIVETNGISNSEDFKSFAKQHSSARTFITLKEERLKRLKNDEQRIEIAERLNLEIDDANNLKIETVEQALLLIRYLCYKVFVDGETNDLLEASAVTKISLV